MISTQVTEGPLDYTRFLVLSTADAAPPLARPKTSLAFAVIDRPGALAEALGEFGRRGINLLKLESRPRRRTTGAGFTYVFFLGFEGTLREEGGGFCGQRLKLLTEPLDLSAHDGLYVDCEPEAECLRRVWKLTCRVAQDRGEVVYQAMLRPQPVGRQRLFVPW